MPDPHGHPYVRSTRGDECVVCVRARASRHYRANRQKKIAYTAAYQATPRGALSHARGQLKHRMRATEARISELEATLNARP